MYGKADQYTCVGAIHPPEPHVRLDQTAAAVVWRAEFIGVGASVGPRTRGAKVQRQTAVPNQGPEAAGVLNARRYSHPLENGCGKRLCGTA